MTAQVTITQASINGGNPITIYCDAVQVSGKRVVETKPNANIDGPVEAQTLAFENPKYVLRGIRFSPDLTTLTYEQVLSLYKLKYTGSNAPTMSVTYGTRTLKAVDGTSTNIKVILESFDYPIDARDSANGYLPTGSLVFVETK
jgi:hypothetical protein